MAALPGRVHRGLYQCGPCGFLRAFARAHTFTAIGRSELVKILSLPVVSAAFRRTAHSLHRLAGGAEFDSWSAKVARRIRSNLPLWNALTGIDGYVRPARGNRRDARPDHCQGGACDDRAGAAVFQCSHTSWACNPGEPLVAQARLSSPISVTGSWCRCLRAYFGSDYAGSLGAALVFGIRDVPTNYSLSMTMAMDRCRHCCCGCRQCCSWCWRIS